MTHALNEISGIGAVKKFSYSGFVWMAGFDLNKYPNTCRMGLKFLPFELFVENGRFEC